MIERVWRRPGLSVPALLVAAVLACGAGAPSSVERNKDLIRRNVEAMNAHDPEMLARTMSPDLVRHSQATPGLVVDSFEDFLRMQRSDWATFPDARVAIDRMVAEGDLVAIFGTYTGTQRGPMGPYPATGRRMSIDIAGVFRIEDDRIAEIWITWDNMAALSQLGLLPGADEKVAP